MRIKCPYCGPRDAQEFSYLGAAGPKRPDGEAGEQAFFDYVYLRDNPAGPNAELWYHASGCRSWLIVTRDTRSHEMLGEALAMPIDAEEAPATPGGEGNS